MARETFDLAEFDFLGIASIPINKNCRLLNLLHIKVLLSSFSMAALLVAEAPSIYINLEKNPSGMYHQYLACGL